MLGQAVLLAACVSHVRRPLAWGTWLAVVLAALLLLPLDDDGDTAARGAARRGRALAIRYPTLANCVSAGLLGGAANLTSQLLAAGPAAPPLALAPIAHFALIPALVMTPVSARWFAALARLRLPTPASLLVDGVVGALVLNACFVAALSALQGLGPSATLAKLSSRWFVGMCVSSNKVWFPAKVVMFYAIPPPYWLLWCNCVSFAWTIVLATLV